MGKADRPAPTPDLASFGSEVGFVPDGPVRRPFRPASTLETGPSGRRSPIEDIIPLAYFTYSQI